MNLSEDLIRCISKYNPIFSIVNKEFNNYYYKINKAAKIIQKQFKLYRAKSFFGKCSLCGSYHINEFYNNDSILYMYDYWYSNDIEDLIQINQTSNFDRTITININNDNIITNNKEKNKSNKKNKYISKKQQRRKLKRNLKYSNKLIRKNIKKNKSFR